MFQVYLSNILQIFFCKIGVKSNASNPAVFSSVNESLIAGGGVSGAIHRAAGLGLEEECFKEIKLFLEQGNSIEKVIFVCFESRIYQVYQELLKLAFPLTYMPESTALIPPQPPRKKSKH